ncbi:protein of unknown function DUF632 [Dillenia turbinata]|uniref:DUF632 domain-containing protein n=1 Tax=Dillenia turbinata TaxID=194707 RepID=A0AAN8UZL2_9MAGN
MGCSSSKGEKNEALRLCKERRRFIKQAIESRYGLAAAHVCYIQSLRNIGVALRRFAEAEVFIESSLSTSATELDKTPSQSSYLSPSPSHVVEVSDSPLRNECPLSPPMSRLSYMRSGGGGATAVTVKVNVPSTSYVDDEAMAFPPPPPPPDSGFSWDFFDPSDESESFRFMGQNGFNVDFHDLRTWTKSKVGETDFHNVEPRGKSEGASSDKRPDLELKDTEISGSSLLHRNGHNRLVRVNSSSTSDGHDGAKQAVDIEARQSDIGRITDGLAENLTLRTDLDRSSSRRDKNAVEKDLCAEREDPSEFITHRAKDFLSSIKDIEHRFFRASEAGKEVSRMLEANKVSVSCSEVQGRPSASVVLAALNLVCCMGKTAIVSYETPHHVTKVITWNRSTSSQSSSSKNPLTAASKDDVDDSGSEFLEEFCMIAGSHSSTLDRLYAWERKLFDEVKASESIRKVYDRKCDQLRHQFAKDFSAHVIDKTRAVVKDLHSRIRVAIHAVDSISKRIEKMRDEELLPQLTELLQGLIRMWKSMLEHHHAQYITISLAYHTRSSTGNSTGDMHRQILAQLQHEMECFGLSFANWVNCHASYVEALNGWLQNCILLPQERRSRRPFSPRRVLAPPIFILCRDWSGGIKSLPSEELNDAIKAFLSDLHRSDSQQAEELPMRETELESSKNRELESKGERNDNNFSNLSGIHSSLTRLLDRLTKYSEASLKMYEEVRQKSEAAQIAYSNCRTMRS